MHVPAGAPYGTPGPVPATNTRSGSHTNSDRPTDRPTGRRQQCEPYPIRATLPAHSLTPSLPAGSPPPSRGPLPLDTPPSPEVPPFAHRAPGVPPVCPTFAPPSPPTTAGDPNGSRGRRQPGGNTSS